MVFKVNHLGKVKSSFMVDPQILTQANTKSWEESFGQELESIMEKEKEEKRRQERGLS